MARDYYDILGVSRTASFDEIKRAFRIKAKECHPDHHAGEAGAEEKFKETISAYDVLKDEQKRAAYDRYGHDAYVRGAQGAGAGGFGGFDFSGAGFESIFEEIFAGFTGGRGRPQAAVRGNDIRADVEITLEEAYRGLKKNLTVESFARCDSCQGRGGKKVEVCPTCGGSGRVRARQGFFVVETECPACHAVGKIVKDPCPACRGTGRTRKKRTLEVNIPAGVDTGIRMRLAGEGDAGPQGNPAGDLYVFLTVKPHPLFKREGEHLFCEVPISMVSASLGDEIEIPILDGSSEKVAVKAGLQTGAQTKLRGRGMPVLKSGSFGDLYISFRVETPTRLTPRQKELLRAFAAEAKDNHAACDDFWCQVKKFWDQL